MKKKEENKTHFHPDYDVKCLSCKYYMDAPAIEIWCDKTGDFEAMPHESCDKHRINHKDPYTIVLRSEEEAKTFLVKMRKLDKKYHLKYIVEEPPQPFNELPPLPKLPRPNPVTRK